MPKHRSKQVTLILFPLTFYLLHKTINQLPSKPYVKVLSETKIQRHSLITNSVIIWHWQRITIGCQVYFYIILNQGGMGLALSPLCHFVQPSKRASIHNTNLGSIFFPRWLNG